MGSHLMMACVAHLSIDVDCPECMKGWDNEMNKPPTSIQKSVIIDIDGVAADFTLGFTSLARKEFNPIIPSMPTVFHQQWNFKGIMTPQEENATWEYIHTHPEWWDTLRPLLTVEDSERLAYIGTRVPIYFVTHRPDASKKHTAKWLTEVLGLEYPSVICSKKKGEVARVLNASHAIDDKLENVWCIHWLSDNPQTKVYLLDRPYNRIDVEVGANNVYRIKSFDEFLDDLEAVYGY